MSVASSSEFRSSSKRRKNADMQPLFLLKTFALVNDGPFDIVSWSPTGDSFIVKDHNRFSEEVIPKYFKHSKFSSFVRQLNFYGFRKVKSGSTLIVKNDENMSEFKHPYFLRGKPELLGTIKRSLVDDTPENLASEVMELRTTVADLQSQVRALTDAVSLIWAKIEPGSASDGSRASISSLLDRSGGLVQGAKDESLCPMAERFAEACIDIGAVDGSFRLSESEMSWRFSERGSQDQELTRISDTLARISEDGIPALSLEHNSELQAIQEEEGESDASPGKPESSREVKKKANGPRNSGSSNPITKRVRADAEEPRV